METPPQNLVTNPQLPGNGMELVTKYFSEFSMVQEARFARLENLYREWNSRINLVSRKDIDSLYEKHVLHSLSIAAVFEFSPGMEIIDMGTGGGFPGIPLAIFFPEVKFHLVDSIAKKLKAVEAIASDLGLKNVTTQHSRVEEIKNRKFHFTISRAVAPLKDLWKWSKPLLKNPASATTGQAPGLICLKGGDLNMEIRESGTRPRIMEVYSLFPEEFFREKYILYISR